MTNHSNDFRLNEYYEIWKYVGNMETRNADGYLILDSWDVDPDYFRLAGDDNESIDDYDILINNEKEIK